MKKNILVPLIILILLLLAGVAYLGYHLMKEKEAHQDMLELAELEKKEMESEYQQFALQYSEMKTQIKNDSIIVQLTQEQERTQRLLDELRQTKAENAAEITRLKKELATVRAVLRQYVLEIDSLNRLNAELMDENLRVRNELELSNQQNQVLTSNNMSLSEKVAIASQLNAANIDIMMLVKGGKERTSHPHTIGKVGMVKATGMKVKFVLSRNTTAENGMRTLYVRVIRPSGEVIRGGISCDYEGKTVECSARQNVEYTGQEHRVDMIIPWETLMPGRYTVQVIADGHEIGSNKIELKK